MLVPGFVSHLELDWEDPRSADFLDGLGSFARLIRFDKRGTGLSDRPGGVPDLETRMDDVRAVMDAVGSERAALFGYSEGAPLSILFAAARPERAADLILYGGYAKRLRSPDYPWAPTAEERDAYAAQVEAKWAFEADMRRMCPSADEAMARWWESRARAAASPGAARALVEMNSRIDVRDVLPSVHVPTLVLHRAGDLDSSPDEGRFIADRIPGARFVELAGVDHCPWIDADDIVDEIQQFLTGEQRPPRTQRVLATIMFTDIVRSTEHAVRVGDSGWTALLSAHDGAVRRELKRFAGERSRRRATASWPFSTGRHGRSARRSRSPRLRASSGSRCVPGSTPGRSSGGWGRPRGRRSRGGADHGRGGARGGARQRHDDGPGSGLRTLVHRSRRA